MLKIGDKFLFEENLLNRQTCLMFLKENNSSSLSVDIGFKNGNFGDDILSPAICINPITTDKNSIGDLVGEKFRVATIEECDDREDTFYLYESEPMVSYDLEVLEIRDNRAHLICKGILIVDGYSEPYIQESFEIDSWVPVIESVNDWVKFENI
ncbi:hypothetical protein [Peptostreptococcus sp.]|jgi:hypothetical protein|uniref:hypothetical protein n=1 Tax=Peptostreptococcus sp. TaxID=1262 RepID=UPI001CAAD27A|nr:hypothetical protein [Peptostreptococcus sp.]MBF1050353.1 hypothetical protein [Peptostreptococcus sp.]